MITTKVDPTLCELGIINTDLLFECETEEAIKATLDALNIDSELSQRTLFLNQVMGGGELTPRERYHTSCAELLSINRLRKQ